MKHTTKQNLTVGKDKIFYEALDQLKMGSKVYSKLRAWSRPNANTSQVANVLPLAKEGVAFKYLQGSGPLHDLKQGPYRSILEKKGLVRCSIVETNTRFADPTEYALANKAYSWINGAWVEYPDEIIDYQNFQSLKTQEFYPVVTIQQGNFVFSFFQGSLDDGKLLIWSVQNFEKALQSGKLEWTEALPLEYEDPEAIQLTVTPTSVTPVVESDQSDYPDWSSCAGKPTNFTFGAPLETIAQDTFYWKPSFFLCEMPQTNEVPSEPKPVETTSGPFCPQELLSLIIKKDTTIQDISLEEAAPEFDTRGESGDIQLHLVEGSVYILGRDMHCTYRDETEYDQHKHNILVWLENSNYNITRWFNLCKNTEQLFADALTEAEHSNTFSVVDLEFDMDVD